MLRSGMRHAGLDPIIAVLVGVGWFIVKALLNRREEADSWVETNQTPAPRPHVPERNEGQPPPVILKPSAQSTPPPARGRVFQRKFSKPEVSPPVIVATTSPPRKQPILLVEETEGPARAEMAHIEFTHEGHRHDVPLEKMVAARMAAINQQTTVHKATKPIQRKRPVAVNELLKNFRQPATIRQALLASFVLNPPKALEEK